MKKSPLVSVIVTTKNEEKNIARLLKSIKQQTFKHLEILVVDNNSSDKTKGIAGMYADNVYQYGPERSAQRNYGAKKAKGKYLLFLDADMELSEDVVRECVDLCEAERQTAGVVIPEQSIGKNFWGKAKAFERSFYNEEGDEITDAARFFSKEAFEKAEGYDESITGPEDWDLPETIRQMGFGIGRIKARIIHHEKISSVFPLVGKKYYYALKAHRYLSKQKISPVSAKTLFFLRPVFYKKWRKLITHPVLSSGMILMLLLELMGGGLGFIIGKMKKL